MVHMGVLWNACHGRNVYVTHGGTVLEEVASFRPLESIVRLLDEGEIVALSSRGVCCVLWSRTVSHPATSQALWE